MRNPVSAKRRRPCLRWHHHCADRPLKASVFSSDPYGCAGCERQSFQVILPTAKGRIERDAFRNHCCRAEMGEGLCTNTNCVRFFFTKRIMSLLMQESNSMCILIANCKSLMHFQLHEHRLRNVCKKQLPSFWRANHKISQNKHKIMTESSASFTLISISSISSVAAGVGCVSCNYGIICL